MLHIVRWFIFITLTCGVIYPGAVYLLSIPIQKNFEFNNVDESLLFKYQIGEPYYFWIRPINYIEENGKFTFTATNLAVHEPALERRIYILTEKIKSINKIYGIEGLPIPIEMVTTSATGNEIIISYKNAMFQARRIAAQRKIPFESINNLILDQLNFDPDMELFPVTVDAIKLNEKLDENFVVPK